MKESSGPQWDAIMLHADDGVATALRPLAAGETARLRIGDELRQLPVTQDIPLCHKLAVKALANGEDILKYGEVIGRAVAPIAAGAWVHVHNLKSSRASG